MLTNSEAMYFQATIILLAKDRRLRGHYEEGHLNCAQEPNAVFTIHFADERAVLLEIYFLRIELFEGIILQFIQASFSCRNVAKPVFHC